MGITFSSTGWRREVKQATADDWELRGKPEGVLRKAPEESNQTSGTGVTKYISKPEDYPRIPWTPNSDQNLLSAVRNMINH